MTFSAFSFIYDGVSSEDFGLYIGTLDNNDTTSSMASTNIELVFDSIANRSENFVYGVKQSEPCLEFKMDIFSHEPLSRSDISYIDAWLFSNTQPKKLVFCQEDMANYVFYALFSKNEIQAVGGKPCLFSCNVICSSAYGYEVEKKEDYVIQNGTVKSIRFNNLSDGIYYLYPKLEFVCNRDNGEIRIKNITDNNREFVISGLSNGEKISIDEWFQITSSTGLYRLEKCNKQWLRLKKGINNIQIYGNTPKVTMFYTFRKGIGS